MRTEESGRANRALEDLDIERGRPSLDAQLGLALPERRRGAEQRQRRREQCEFTAFPQVRVCRRVWGGRIELGKAESDSQAVLR